MEKKTGLLQHTTTYGAISGALLIIFSVILYMLDIMPTNAKRMLVIGFVSYAVMITMIVTGTRAYRDKVLGGVIAYDKAFLTGLLIILFSAILNNFYTLIFTTWIDPGYIDRMYAAMKDWMYNMFSNAGYPDALIDQTMQNIEKQQANYSPLKAFFSGIGLSALVGGIISTITAAFIKKNPNPFTQVN
jgi:hypothetical protein